MNSYPPWSREISQLAYIVVSGGEWRMAEASDFQPGMPPSFWLNLDSSEFCEQVGELLDWEQTFGREDDNAAS